MTYLQFLRALRDAQSFAHRRSIALTNPNLSGRALDAGHMSRQSWQGEPSSFVDLTSQGEEFLCRNAMNLY